MPQKTKILAFLLLIFMIVPDIMAEQFYPNSYAVVIGIDDYSLSGRTSLKYAVEDAKGMAKFFKNQGFEVYPFYNEEASRTAIIDNIRNLASKLKPNDRVVFFFAGHGETESLAGKDWGYIVPSSGDKISMGQLRELSEQMGAAKHQLFIMDCCFGGLIVKTRSPNMDENTPHYLQDITRRFARQIIAAGGKDQLVIDGGFGNHSVFTGTLLEALEKGLGDINGDGYITFPELYSYIYYRASNSYQTPMSGRLPGDQGGEFVFHSPIGRTLPIAKVIEPINSKKLRGTEEKYYKGQKFQDCPECPPMVVIPPGTFRMGTNAMDKGGHIVEIKKFAISQYEVTFKEYDYFAENVQNIEKPWDGMMGREKKQPVINISWNAANEYVAWLAKKIGKNYRLPSEAEWEYAARANSIFQYYWGDNIGKNNANCIGCGSQWDGEKTVPVGSFKPNNFGLYDVIGNISEWVQDCWKDNYKHIPTDGSPYNTSCYEFNGHVIKGGSYIDKFEEINLTYRDYSTNKSSRLGFRVACDL
ncbi:putative SUMF1/EgtB/PvdO family nonheme iron enzyme [Candidatus Magnetomoraceae bacterium gMMP-13]